MSHHIDPEKRPQTLEIVFGLRLLRPAIFVGLVVVGVALARVLQELGEYVLRQMLMIGALLCHG